MKNFTRSFLCVLFMGIISSSFTVIYAQKGTNVQKLEELSQKFKLKWEEDNRTARNFANRNGIPFRFETEEGVLFELQSIEDGKPMYYTTENVNSAATTSTNKVHPGGSAGLNLDGSGITIHEWDGGSIRTSHQEFGNRAAIGDNPPSASWHSTHVAGTIIASGVNSSAKGMAPNANLRAFDWNSDESEMATEAAAGALLSNHSYGYIRGWYYNGSAWSWYGNTSISTLEDYKFGFYDSQASDWDLIAYNAPYYLIVKSAGNERGDGPTNGAYPQDGPYDCISHAAVGKNILTVGAVGDIIGGYSGPSSVSMSSFSSWGPADDGRIKPDIVTNGVGLYSSYNSNDASYATASGTSMAAPSATGSLALLQQHYENLNGSGNFMRASTLKGLVIATADEAGTNPGPDYKFGWGLMNTEKAALKISEDQTLNVVDELVLNNGGTYTRTVHSNGIDPLKVTICWTELPGIPVSASLDPSDAMLINDLDLRITIGGQTYYSWKLDRDNPENAATNNSENDVDNVEMVFIANPAEGDYTITVDHDGTLSGGSQEFSIIYDGISAPSIKKGPYLVFEGINSEMKILWQNLASSTDQIKWGTSTSYSEGSASNTEYGSDHQHAYTITGLTPGTKYYYQVEADGALYNGSFNTAPVESSTALKFLAYGDTRSYPLDHNDVAQEIISTYTNEPDYQTVLISMGDLINDGNTEADWSNQFFETGLPYINSMLSNIPYQSCIGNHEGNGVLFQKYFPYDYQSDRYYSFNYGPALFIVLDQYVSYAPGSNQYIWLENELATTTKAWKIIYYHEPGWTAAGGHGNNVNVQNYIQPLCEQYGVNITFAGHNHYYARAEVTLNNTTVQHLTTGGGGAPLRTPDPNQQFIVSASASHHFCKVNIVDENIMQVEVIDKSGTIIDQFTINQLNLSPPEVSITAPTNNTHYTVPQAITINAFASDADGTIDNVEFFADGTSIGTDNTLPYSINWTIPANGSYSLTATATDNLGTSTTSAVINITVGDYSDIVSARISTSNDDVEESIAGQMYMNSTDIELVYDTYNTAGNQTVGLRFIGLGIPQGATINNASIQFTVDEANSETTNLNIVGESTDNSQAFSTTGFNVSSRTTTSNSVNWNPPAWSTIGAAGPDQQTPDLSGIIQEIVDRPGFTSSSAISFIITGTGERTAEAYDGAANSAALLTIDYTIGSNNNPPVFISDPIIEAVATEDASYSSSLGDDATDDDEDPLTYSKVDGPVWLTIASDGGLSGTPLNGDVGLNTWTVSVSDGNGGSDQATLQIMVVNTNDAPQFTAGTINKGSTDEDSPYSGSLANDASDQDAGDVLTFSYVNGPGWLNIAADGGLSGTPLNGDVGLNTWTVSVSDGNGGSDQATIQITVINTNDPPQFVTGPINKGNIDEDSPYSGSLANDASDQDVGDILTFAYLTGPGWLNITDDGGLSGTPLNGDVGLNTWTVSVSDGNGGSDQATLQITVINTNDPPIFTSDPINMADAIIDNPYSASIAGNVSDADIGDVLTFSKVSFSGPGADWLSIETNGDILGTPGINDVGINTWTIMVEDGDLQSDQADLVIVVTDPSNITYCLSSGIAASEWIESVLVGSNPSNNSGSDGGYKLFDAVPLLLDANSSVNFTLTPGFPNRSSHQYWAIWIDYNKNGFFTDPGELIYSPSKSKNPVSGTFITGSQTGLTRMRISMSDSGTPSSCGTIGGGEVEDYLVQIVEPVALKPIADFTASPTAISEGQSVQFTDLSKYGPTDWSWNFGDGSPLSTQQHPSHIYSNAGTYSVTLTVSNSYGSDAITFTDYILVSVQPVLPYCEPSGINNSSTWIASINIDGIENITGQNAFAYNIFSDPGFNLSAGSTYSFVLTPNNTSSRNFWRIWIDATGNGDFIEAGETLFAANNKKGAVSGSLTIPSTIVSSTRLRITMKTGSSPASCDDGFNGEVEDYLVNIAGGTGKSSFFDSDINEDMLTKTSLAVYPNPVDELLNIQFEGWEGRKMIRLIDMTGRTILTKYVYDSRTDINVASYPKGLYMLDINNGMLRELRKISIQ